MTEKKQYSLAFWNQLMGNDIPKSERQPLQPAIIENGKLKLFAGTLNSRFAPGTKVGFQLHGNYIALAEVLDGKPVQEASFWDEGKFIELELSEAIRNILPKEEQFVGMIVNGNEYLELLPIRVQEHEPDILGPRIIDELQFLG